MLSNATFEVQNEKVYFAECQECGERVEGDSVGDVRRQVKELSWLTKRWVPSGFDVEFNLLCPVCVENYKDEEMVEVQKTEWVKKRGKSK